MAVAIANGAFQGHEIGKEAGKKGWDLAGYTFLGAAMGGASGFIGTEIEAMDFIGSGTLGLIASSTYSSYGMYELSGRTREFTTSVGFGSMKWSKGRFDYFMDGNNTVLDDIGYFFGGMTNLSEGIQYIDSKTGWE
ncbi:MAG: hypothetical protein HUU10_14810, partial [Bacteroidetes bacterium]|nr:hypothetical protein [Bacteroidota bacterium]